MLPHSFSVNQNCSQESFYFKKRILHQLQPHTEMGVKPTDRLGAGAPVTFSSAEVRRTLRRVRLEDGPRSRARARVKVATVALVNILLAPPVVLRFCKHNVGQRSQTAEGRAV